MERHVRLALFITIAFSSLGVLLACSAPTPGLEESNSTSKDDGGKKKPDGGQSSGSSSSEPPDDLPPPTPPSNDGESEDETKTDGGGATPPAPTPFLMLDVRYPVDADRYITQCTPDGKAQLVWTTTGAGANEYSRFAKAAYEESPGVHYPCGALDDGQYPIVLSWLPPEGVPKGTWIARCVGKESAHVYRVLGTHAGHPAATFQYPEQYAGCP